MQGSENPKKDPKVEISNCQRYCTAIGTSVMAATFFGAAPAGPAGWLASFVIGSGVTVDCAQRFCSDSNKGPK